MTSRFMPGIIAALSVVLIPEAAPALAQERTGGVEDTVQTREVSISANLLEGAVEGGERIRRLTGNVALRQEDTRLWARRATQYLDRREILFTGDVLVVERGDSLRADTVLYNSGNKTGRARGSVRLSDGDVLVFAPSGLYFTREKRALFEDGVTLVDSSATLRSREGEYWSEEKRAEFYGDVELYEDRMHLEADSVTYLRESDVSMARGHVFVEHRGEEESVSDSLSRTLLFGNRAFNDEKASFSRMEGRPLLMQLEADSMGAEVDTLLIRAVLLEMTRSDTLERLVAVDSVRIWDSELAAVADSLVYDRISMEDDTLREEVRLYGEPMVWFETNQVSGDTLLIEARAGSLDTLRVRQRAFVARLDTTLQRVQQVRGLHLVAAFRDDSLRTLSIGPQAEAITFRSDEEDQPAGGVRMSSDRIDLHFEKDDVSRISAVRDVEGTYYSENQLPDPFELDDFRWLPERRPTRDGLLREVRLQDRPDSDGEHLSPAANEVPTALDLQSADDSGAADEPPTEPTESNQRRAAGESDESNRN